MARKPYGDRADEQRAERVTVSETGKVSQGETP